MEYYDSLNKVVKTIENNLENEISYEDLAKIIGTSSYTLQRIFAFLTGITLTEYIRKRRLSRAIEDLTLTDAKIIDIAIKYGYDSGISFSNAFKKMHGVTPTAVRKENMPLKIFPTIHFEPITNVVDELEFRIVNLNKQTLYGVTTGIIDADDKKTIADLYQKIETNGMKQYMIDNSNGKKLYYGASEPVFDGEVSEKYRYYILGTKPKEEFLKFELPKSTWACFKLNSTEQEDILKLYNTIYTKWLPNSKYEQILPYSELEIYYHDYCELCIPVK